MVDEFLQGSIFRAHGIVSRGVPRLEDKELIYRLKQVLMCLDIYSDSDVEGTTPRFFARSTEQG